MIKLTGFSCFVGQLSNENQALKFLKALQLFLHTYKSLDENESNRAL